MITRPPASSLRNKSGGPGVSTLRKHRPDYMLIVLASLLLIIGIVVVTAISPGLAAGRGVPQNYYVTKQITAAPLSDRDHSGVAPPPAPSAYPPDPPR